MLPIRSSLTKVSRRLLLVSLFFAGICFTSQAQVIDTLNQRPQLETVPSVTPAKPPVTPTRPTPPVQTAPTPTVTPPPAEEEPYEEKPSILSKMFVGGSGDLGFSSNPYYGSYFNIGASPLLGYRLNKIVALGPGLVYNYYNLGGNSFSDYGLKAFTQIIVYKAFFLHAEHQLLNAKAYDVDQTGQIVNEYRQNIQSTLAGAGYRQMASDRFGFDLYVLFNVANSTGETSSRPIIRAGIIYNLK